MSDTFPSVDPVAAIDPITAIDPIAVDPITVEVIGSALVSIVEEMGETLVRSSYSTNIKERRDCSTALFTHAGETLCQAEHIPMHLGSFIGIVPAILARHPIETMRPGDVFIGNDAYEGGGTHLPDFVLAEPIFVDGAIIAWAVNTAHHSDFADRGHAHIFQEGLRIPPIRLKRAGEIVADVEALILLNCQVPRERLSDLRAQMAANRLGVARLQELAARYGTARLLAAGAALMAYAERKMRAGLAAIPDGTWSFADVFDNPEIDGELTFSLTLTKRGETVHLAFDAPPQQRAGFNMTFTALLSTVYYAVKAVVDPSILPNAGLARPITVSAPSGSVLNCRAPAAVFNRIGPCQRVVDLVFGAFAQVVPERVTAAACGTVMVASFDGVDPLTGETWIYLETIGGGGGARSAKDGLDGIQVHMTNTSNLPVEALEIEYPLTVLRYELAEGSAGPGRQRGGMGLRRVYRAETDCRIEIDTSRLRSAPWGIAGGGPAAGSSLDLGAGTAPLAAGRGTLASGGILTLVTPGGGGYGDPRERTPAATARDRADGLTVAGDR
ncbi:methylhydantoinase [Prosthecomicrobium hirschii]|uniref:Methylhydantoinase n=1 Tax=Prosthecodimorpha hirschii TaxID=665126 RepID=A0A0P6VIM0_9HYPH|nr:hydantoinase B/oxoprolinase family protein [Prosthecomicrobium hirschii]KPL50936.1 methylhydantoinase [Prosthecomicrobium hirschii]